MFVLNLAIVDLIFSLSGSSSGVNGKSSQSLINVAIAHSKHQGKSLVVCPSTLVQHWVKEVQKFFSNTNSCLKVMSYDGNAEQRKEKWSDEEQMKNYDVIVTM